VQDFDGVAVDHTDNRAGEVGGKDSGSQADPDQKTPAASARLAASITVLLVVLVLCGAILPVTPAAQRGVIPLP
jgi:hypothetical protein